MSSFACSACTFVNTGGTATCSLCGTARPGTTLPVAKPTVVVVTANSPPIASATPPQLVRANSTGSTDTGTTGSTPTITAGTMTGRTCKRCTYINPMNSTVCELCSFSLVESAGGSAAPAPKVTTAAGSAGSGGSGAAPPPSAATPSPSTKSVGGFVLTDAQRQQFFDTGYLVLKNVVPAKSIAAALRAINKGLGTPQSPSDQAGIRRGAWFPELSKSPVITDLFNKTAAISATSQLIGANIPYTWGGQIALRFPGTLCHDRAGTGKYIRPLSRCRVVLFNPSFFFPVQSQCRGGIARGILTASIPKITASQRVKFVILRYYAVSCSLQSQPNSVVISPCFLDHIVYWNNISSKVDSMLSRMDWKHYQNYHCQNQCK